MSKLYLAATTDMIETRRIARASKWIDIALHYDESDYTKYVLVRFDIPSDTGKPTLWVDGEKIKEIEL